MTGSIRLRLFLLALVGIGIALAIAGAGLTALFGRHVERRIGGELDVHVALIAGNLRIAPDGSITLAREPADPRFYKPFSGIYWQVIDENTGALNRSRSLWDTTLTLPPDTPRAGETHSHSLLASDGEELILHERRVILDDAGRDRPVRIGVALNRSELQPLMQGFAQDLLPSLGILGVVLLAGAWFQVGAGLRPLREVRAGVAAVGSGATSRVPGAVPAEVAPLVAGINDLLDQRDQTVVRARDRAADLAHGLKTPLTALAGDAARLRSKGESQLADDIEAAVLQMKRTIDRELARSRLRHTQLSTQKVQLQQSCEAVARTLARTPVGETVVFDIDIEPGLVAGVIADDLTEVLGNLMENAVRAARSRVRVIASRATEAAVRVVVEDDGEGAEPQRMAALAARGERADETGNGAGLGLAIVGDILAGYGASLGFRRSDLGGLSVAFTLPT